MKLVNMLFVVLMAVAEARAMVQLRDTKSYKIEPIDRNNLSLSLSQVWIEPFVAATDFKLWLHNPDGGEENISSKLDIVYILHRMVAPERYWLAVARQPNKKEQHIERGLVVDTSLKKSGFTIVMMNQLYGVLTNIKSAQLDPIWDPQNNLSVASNEAVRGVAVEFSHKAQQFEADLREWLAEIGYSVDDELEDLSQSLRALAAGIL